MCLLMTKFTNVQVVEEDDFATAWYRAVIFVIAHGIFMRFSSKKEPKKAYNSIHTIILFGRAIDQMLRGEFHPQYPFGNKKGDSYKDEFDRGWFENDYILRPEIRTFVYTYIERIIRYTRPTQTIPEFIQYYLSKRDYFVDQLKILKDQLKEQVETGITSNRCQLITWIPFKDLFSNSPPCLQRIQVIYLGNNEVEIHITWRSRDLFTAWMANLSGLINMINKEVVLPNGCKIVRVVEFIDSLHIYEGDIDEAKKVRPHAMNPQFMFRKKQESTVYVNGEHYCSSFFI